MAHELHEGASQRAQTHENKVLAPRWPLRVDDAPPLAPQKPFLSTFSRSRKPVRADWSTSGLNDCHRAIICEASCGHGEVPTVSSQTLPELKAPMIGYYKTQVLSVRPQR